MFPKAFLNIRPMLSLARILNLSLQCQYILEIIPETGLSCTHFCHAHTTLDSVQIYIYKLFCRSQDLEVELENKST